jgi:hypothetical protein
MLASLQSARRMEPIAPIAPAPPPEATGSPFRFVIRCVVERKADQWQAFSLELGLAAQADTKAEAKRKLEAMIQSYIEDAISGEDQAHAYELLSRKATWRVYLLYWLALLAKGVGRGRTHHVAFNESLPLIPKFC